MNYFLNAIKNKYALFDGRSRRAEFWQYLLISAGINFVLNILIRTTGSLAIGGIGGLISLALILPTIGMWIRRMHDINKVGWYCLIPFYNLYLASQEGTRGPNQYGPDPKGGADVFTPNQPTY